MSTFDSMAFRRALGAFTTGVTVVTARSADSVRVGVTANSFSSVSLDPPLVLWSLAKTAHSMPFFQTAEYFAVHILAAGQADLAHRFGSRGEDKFANVEIENGLGNTPLLDGCCTRMQCKIVHRYEGGDHIIYVGEVVDLVSNRVQPLAFQAGNYALASRKVDDTPLIPSVGTEFTGDFLGYLLWRADFQFETELRTRPPVSNYSDPEFRLLGTLFYSNWRTLEGLLKVLFHENGRAEAIKALSSLEERGLVERKTREDGSEVYGINQAGENTALSLLAAAKSTEAAFLERLGDWEGVALKNLLKAFILETAPKLPHPWERAEDQTPETQKTA